MHKSSVIDEVGFTADNPDLGKAEQTKADAAMMAKALRIAVANVKPKFTKKYKVKRNKKNKMAKESRRKNRGCK